MTPQSSQKTKWYLVRIQLDEPISEHRWDLFTVLANDVGSEGNQDFLAGELIEGADFYFDSSKVESALAVSSLKDLLLRIKITNAAFSVLDVDPLNWIQTGKRFYEAKSITDQFVVGPQEERTSFATQDVHYISIEYGAAFGTGSHPTTVLCMQLLQRQIRPNITILDFGTGTGVLSFAALYLGAAFAFCVDCSDDAELIFRRNAEDNRMIDSVYFHLGSNPRDVIPLADRLGKDLPKLILCNMLLSDSENLLTELREFNAPMIYSGYLEDQSVVVRLSLEQAGFNIVHEQFSENWGACTCEPKAI